MRKGIQIFAALVLSASAATACGGHDKSATSTSNGDAAMTGSAPAGTATAASPSTAPATAPAAHHSKLGGAVAGAAIGHVLGGHAVAGAAAGALIQHERNKH